MIPYHSIAGLVFNQPLLVTPDKGQAIGSFILGRIDRRADRGTGETGEDSIQFEPIERADGSTETIAPRASQFVGEYRSDAKGRPLPYRVAHDGAVAIISVVGELVNRGAWIGASSGLVSYEGIKHQVRTAEKDDRVKTVVFDLSSPGGEAGGAFALATTIRKLGQKKMTIAVVNGMALSGGYVIASACRKVVTTEDGYSGSIGVYWMHLDLSEYLAKLGVKPTYIFAGAHKVDGNPYEELPAPVRGRIKARIDRIYGMFVDSVAAGRPKLTPDAIRATEADVYFGADAVTAGLADEVGTFEGVIDSLAPAPAAAAVNTTGGTMAQRKETAKPVAKTPKAGPGGCSECDCPSFEGDGENCARESCGHANGSHADEATSDEAKDQGSGANAGGNVDVDAILEENRKLKAEAAASAIKEKAAEAKRLEAAANATVDGWLTAGKVSGNAEKKFRILYVAAATGAAVTAQMVEDAIAALPTIDGSRIAAPKTPRTDSGVTAEDFAIAPTNGEASKKIAAAVAARQADNPKFTAQDLFREVVGPTK